jgi:ferrous iron transport protein A
MDIKKLSELKLGESGIIHSFGADELSIKLMEMGCMVGETVKVEQVAMMGDPISIYVAGYNLSLRKKEAEEIFVEHITK